MIFFAPHAKLVRSPVVRAVAALSLTQLIGWGATFWLPAITGPAMAKELSLPLSTIMAGPTIMLVIMALVSWPLGSLLGRYGARPIMVLGSLLGAAGLFVMGTAHGLATYGLSWIILGFAGAGMLTTTAQIALTEVAGEQSRSALGVLVLAGGLTSTIIWPPTGLLQQQWGWRATTHLYAVLMVVICLPLHWSVLSRRRRDPPPAKVKDAAASIDLSRMALLSLSFAANGFVTWGFALTIIILFEAKGLDHASALTAAASIGIAQWAGRMIDVAGGWRLSGFVAGLTGMALFPLSFAVLLLAGGFIGTMLFAALYGIASGITAVTRATLPFQVFPRDAYAQASARMAVPLNLAFATAPPAFTAVINFASEQAALWLALLLSIVAFAAMVGSSLLYRLPAEISPPKSQILR